MDMEATFAPMTTLSTSRGLFVYGKPRTNLGNMIEHTATLDGRPVVLRQWAKVDLWGIDCASSGVREHFSLQAHDGKMREVKATSVWIGRRDGGDLYRTDIVAT